MDFLEVIEQAREVLRSKGRVTYRALKRQFALDEEALEDLKNELIEAERVAVDENGKVLVWVGASPVPSSKFQIPKQDSEPRTPNPELSPVSYTPPHLAERIRAEQAALEARGASEGERKTITALFADLKGSTALIEGLDPEDARAIIDPALQLMMDAVHRYEGYVAQALGDGIFALFGAPIAHEDHPQRALYAALHMQDAMRRYADTLRAKGHPPLLMRVGVNTGEVVVRSIRKDDLHADYVPIGHSINLAARMEQLAAPGSILVTAYTHWLTDGYFAFKDLGQTQIKGVEEPLNVYEVLGAGPLRTRLQVSSTRRGLTRFVGRQSELEQMQRALEQAKTGHGQIVGVMGEPGLGKSRLFYELVGAYDHTPLRRHGCLVLEAYSVSHGKASPYLPVIELLKNYFDIQTQDDERKRREKVIGKVGANNYSPLPDRSLEDTLPYLFALLGIEEQPSPLQQMDPQIRRRRTFDALKKLLLRESLNQPLIIIFEDLHWIDSETQGFLDVLSESVASTRILLLVNYRPEYRQEWGQKTYYTQLRLAPLDKAEAEELLTFLLGTDTGLTTLKHLILEKTEGTPFFMEEVAQTLAEEGALVGERGHYRLEKTPTELHISPTVQGVLAARIDRLAAAEKALLQQLAVIGREFPVSLIRQVIAQPEEELYRLLSFLQRKEFLYEQPAFPEVKYIFKHALTQEVAYGTVLQEKRKMLHENTAQAIESLYQGRLDEHYSDLAHHYSRSGNTEKAVEYLHLAGQQATQRSANAEAIIYLTAALALLKLLPDTPERTQHELDLQITLGPALMATKGYAAPEVERVYARARELCQQVGETPQLFPVLRGLWLFSLIRGELHTARELGEQCLRFAQNAREPTLLVQAHYALGDALWSLGDFAVARELLEQGFTYYDPQQHRTHISQYGFDPGVACLSHAALALWPLGYPDRAWKKVCQAINLAQELSHPQSMAFALVFAAALQQHCRDGPAVQERTQAAITLAADFGFPFWLAWANMLEGWARAVQGEKEKGTAQIQQGMTAWQAIGVGWNRPYWLALLAEAYGAMDQAKEGLAVLNEDLKTAGKIGERFFYEAELYRLKGTLTLQQSETRLGQVSGKARTSQKQSEGPDAQTEVEACFLKAIKIAQHQQAKSLELRAVTSLARLWQQQGKQHEAHNMLSEIYNWFTEGFDTKDLQEAKVLLEELA